MLGADFLAYADPNASEAQRSLMPPQRMYWFDGGRFGPHVYGFKGARDPQTFKRVYRADPSQKVPIRFFAEGFEYRFLGADPDDAASDRGGRRARRRPRRSSCSAPTCRAAICGRG